MSHPGRSEPNALKYNILRPCQFSSTTRIQSQLSARLKFVWTREKRFSKNVSDIEITIDLRYVPAIKNP